MKNRLPVILEGTATTASGDQRRPFYIQEKLNHLINDSPTYDCLVNFDKTIGEHGTFTLKAGEIITDLPIACETISLQGIGGNVEFRALGV
jgi:hypothetical protein